MEEALDLSFDRLLMMMMILLLKKNCMLQVINYILALEGMMVNVP